jgi:hypothetical protein
MPESLQYNLPPSFEVAQAAIESANSAPSGISLNLTADYTGSISISDVRYDFDVLRERWHRERGISSSLGDISSTPTYRWIIHQGDRFLPLIIEDLEKRRDPDLWFDALQEITHCDPVNQTDRNNYRKMAKIWVKWYRSHRHAQR